jgi:hypothetical protein
MAHAASRLLLVAPKTKARKGTSDFRERADLRELQGLGLELLSAGLLGCWAAELLSAER